MPRIVNERAAAENAQCLIRDREALRAKGPDRKVLRETSLASRLPLEGAHDSGGGAPWAIATPGFWPRRWWLVACCGGPSRLEPVRFDRPRTRYIPRRRRTQKSATPSNGATRISLASSSDDGRRKSSRPELADLRSSVRPRRTRWRGRRLEPLVVASASLGLGGIA